VKEIFFIIRFPFFLLGVVLGSVFWIPLMILWFAIDLIRTPIGFMKAAFANDQRILSDHCKETFDIERYLELCTGLWRWCKGT
jgi:hypothetical protein